MLIDSGASNSVINKILGREKFDKYWYKIPFCITGLGTKEFYDDNIQELIRTRHF